METNNPTTEQKPTRIVRRHATEFELTTDEGSSIRVVLKATTEADAVLAIDKVLRRLGKLRASFDDDV